MTREAHAWRAERAALAPYGRLVRVESPATEDGIPDLYYRLRRVPGWCELKADLDKLTLAQVLWGEAEVAAGGRWFLLYRAPGAWAVLDVGGARAVWASPTGGAARHRIAREYAILWAVGPFPTAGVVRCLTT